ncbi:hypothetical protein [Enterococcus spodopteracolus]|uniref:hypothetical protein n=2 Tax=Enterococcus TaxID=1350 RepID=UPI002647F59D|nr:hypothetical protein [Enterococcus spodopteracolus]
MSVKDVAKKQILKMEHTINQISEAEDLLISFKSPALNNLNELMSDIEIGIPTQYLGRSFFQDEIQSRWHRVQLEGDLGIKDVQEIIRKFVIESVEKRIDELENDLRKMIYYSGEKHE